MATLGCHGEHRQPEGVVVGPWLTLPFVERAPWLMSAQALVPFVSAAWRCSGARQRLRGDVRQARLLEAQRYLAAGRRASRGRWV